jgi:predicted Fe-Mo cluster-binding NifX family protein
MKISIPSSDKVKVSDHFGRAKYFAIFDTEKKSFEYLNNESNLNAPQGAGIQSAASIINSGAGIVISPHIGLKAFDFLKEANIKMYHLSKKDCSINAALDLYKKGELGLMKSSNR